jgi:uncharacterized protein
MKLELSAVTLGVKDLSRAKKFYTEGLGCAIDQDHPGFVSLKLGDSLVKLALYPLDALAGDAGVDPDGSGFRGVTLNYTVEGGEHPKRTEAGSHSTSEEQIAEVMAHAERAGGKILKPTQKAQ